jgi:hypothetical protein
MNLDKIWNCGQTYLVHYSLSLAASGANSYLNLKKTDFFYFKLLKKLSPQQALEVYTIVRC